MSRPALGASPGSRGGSHSTYADVRVPKVPASCLFIVGIQTRMPIGHRDVSRHVIG